MLAVHYEAMIDEFEKVPANILFGDVQCGKSEATKAALSTTGMLNANFSLTFLIHECLHTVPKQL